MRTSAPRWQLWLAVMIAGVVVFGIWIVQLRLTLERLDTGMISREVDVTLEGAGLNAEKTLEELQYAP